MNVAQASLPYGYLSYPYRVGWVAEAGHGAQIPVAD